MGSICFSSAPILRCSSFTRDQNLAFFVPPVVEILFSTSLIFFNWGSGRCGQSVSAFPKLMKIYRRHLLLTADGWVYLLLALMELLSQILPAVRGNLSLFRTFDVGIGECSSSAEFLMLNRLGVASFLPLFFYTFFLYLFTKNELMETLPENIRNVSKLTLIAIVPALAVMNEISSFIGVTIRE